MLAHPRDMGKTDEIMIQSMVNTPAAMIAPTESEVPKNFDCRAAATAKVMSAHKPVKALRPRTPILIIRDIDV